MKNKFFSSLFFLLIMVLFNLWVLNSLPIPTIEYYQLIFGHEQTPSQAFSIIANFIFIWGSSVYIFYKLIRWIEKD